MKTNTQFKFAVALSLLVTSAKAPVLGESLATLAASHFDDTNYLADGWQGVNTNNGPGLTYKPGGATSNSVGYISLSQTQGDSQTMHFAAPEKFLGDKRSAYNGFLTMRLKQSANTSLYIDYD